MPLRCKLPFAGTVAASLRAACSLTLLAATLLTALPDARAQGEPTWGATRRFVAESFAVLGVPETDDIRFSLRCRDGSVVEVDPFLLLDRPADVTPAIRFRVDGQEFIRGATYGRLDEMLAGYPVVASVSTADPLLTALRTGSEVSASVHPPEIRDLTSTVSLTGSADAIDAMLAACRTPATSEDLLP